MTRARVVTLLIVLSYQNYAFAYIDPASVSIVLQGVLAAIAGVFFAIKIYWHKIIELLRKINVFRNNKKN